MVILTFYIDHVTKISLHRWKEHLKISGNGKAISYKIAKLELRKVGKYFSRWGGEVCAPRHTHDTRHKSVKLSLKPGH